MSQPLGGNYTHHCCHCSPFSTISITLLVRTKEGVILWIYTWTTLYYLCLNKHLPADGVLLTRGNRLIIILSAACLMEMKQFHVIAPPYMHTCTHSKTLKCSHIRSPCVFKHTVNASVIFSVCVSLGQFWLALFV